jgi:hypothetical protein
MLSENSADNFMGQNIPPAVAGGYPDLENMLTGPSHNATVSIRQNNKTTGYLKPTEFMRTTTRLGLGTASLGSLDGDDADDSAIATIRAAIDAGIDYQHSPTLQ